LGECDYLNPQIPRYFTQIKDLPSNLSASTKHRGRPFDRIQQWTTDSTSTTAKVSWRESREMGCLKPGMPTRREWSIVGWTVMDIFLHRPPRSDNGGNTSVCVTIFLFWQIFLQHYSPKRGNPNRSTAPRNNLPRQLPLPPSLLTRQPTLHRLNNNEAFGTSVLGH